MKVTLHVRSFYKNLTYYFSDKKKHIKKECFKITNSSHFKGKRVHERKRI